MSVDFWDRNKAYPKDAYPLLRIELLDMTLRHEMLSFIDAYSSFI